MKITELAVLFQEISTRLTIYQNSHSDVNITGLMFIIHGALCKSGLNDIESYKTMEKLWPLMDEFRGAADKYLDISRDDDISLSVVWGILNNIVKNNGVGRVRMLTADLEIKRKCGGCGREIGHCVCKIEIVNTLTGDEEEIIGIASGSTGICGCGPMGWYYGESKYFPAIHRLASIGVIILGQPSLRGHAFRLTDRGHEVAKLLQSQSDLSRLALPDLGG